MVVSEMEMLMVSTTVSPFIVTMVITLITSSSTFPTYLSITSQMRLSASKLIEVLRWLAGYVPTSPINKSAFHALVDTPTKALWTLIRSSFTLLTMPAILLTEMVINVGRWTGTTGGAVGRNVTVGTTPSTAATGQLRRIRGIPSTDFPRLAYRFFFRGVADRPRLLST